jgi:hypothetical protein
MLTQVQATFTNDPLIPYYKPELAVTRAVNLAPSTVYQRGTVLGKIANSANAVQTISDTGTVSGGTYTISGTNPVTGASFTTAAIAYDANNAAIKAALEAVLGAGITVTVAGSGMPTNDTTLTFSGTGAGVPVPLMTITNSVTGGGSLAIANTTVGRSAGTYAAYADGGTTDPAVCILQYACATDALGQVYFGSTAGSEFGSARPDAPAYFAGVFATSELVGLDANGVTDLKARLEGTTSDGVLWLL